MKYLILIYTNPATREVWDALPEARREAGYRAHLAFQESLAASGELIAAEALADPATARRVTATGDRTTTADGPFAEAKELLAGFYLIECESLDRAIEHGSRVPEAAFGLVEVRPVLDLRTS
jgi:hypothetical protein